MIGEAQGKRLPLVAVLLAVIILISGWAVIEDGDDEQGVAIWNGISGANSRLAAVALQEYEENGNVQGSGEKYWEYWGKPLEQWCVDFVYYCADRLALVGEGRPFGPYTAGCLDAWYHLKQAGALMFAVGEADPRMGDLVFWYMTDGGCATDVSNCTALCHVGIVVDYADGTMTTVEGNSGGLGSARNYVAKNTYGDLTGQSWRGAAIWGFARIHSGVGSLTDMIKTFEGFSKYPFWDYAQYSVGYGTACPKEKYDEYMTYGIPEADAIALLEEYIAAAANAVDAYIAQNELHLSTYQRDAIVSLTYNIGQSWTSSGSYTALRHMLSAPSDDLNVVQTFAVISRAGGEILPALVERRICEAHLFLTGEYITDYTQSNFRYTILQNRVIVSEKEAQHENPVD